ncbi:MAG: SET domain-containing protein-lysine N-methyltransferase [Chlamydiota bacterium]
MIKVQLEGEDKPQLYSPEKFEEIMQVKFFPCLVVHNEKTQKKIEKRCVRALEEGDITRKQRWLGVYYGEEIAKGWSPDLTIRWINPTLGYGVFTNQAFEPGDLVSEYTGILKKHRLFRKEGNDYLFYYYVKKKWNSSYYIDAGECGNYSRFINHSSNGNLEPMYVLSGGIIHILLMATKQIPIGAQLCYDYGDIYWKKREKPLRNHP